MHEQEGEWMFERPADRILIDAAFSQFRSETSIKVARNRRNMVRQRARGTVFGSPPWGWIRYRDNNNVSKFRVKPECKQTLVLISNLHINNNYQPKEIAKYLIANQIYRVKSQKVPFKSSHIKTIINSEHYKSMNRRDNSNLDIGKLEI